MTDASLHTTAPTTFSSLASNDNRRQTVVIGPDLRDGLVVLAGSAVMAVTGMLVAGYLALPFGG